jgi:hypothetical protein
LPANAACFFTPATFTPTATANSGTGFILIQTAGNGPAFAQKQPTFPRRPVPLLALLALPAVLLLRRRGRFAMMGLLLATLCIGLGLSGCSGSVANPLSAVTTPVGTSTVTVIAQSGATTHTSTINLTVTQH